MAIPSGKLISGLRKLQLPAQIRLILVVMLRFVPTVVLEASEIKNSMRVRGLWGSFGTVVRHPMDTLEYAFVPLIFRSLKVSDELSASAIVRGIEYPGKKESYYLSRFHVVDYIITAVTLGVCLICCL
jgi:energy-coupling factor transport system permease protein